jgi:tellurite resistance protein TerC
MDVPLWLWFAVIGGIAVALLLDLLVFHRDAHEVSGREAAITSAAWVALGLAFGAGVWIVAGPTHGGEWFAGYAIEKALATDNIFVFAVILGAFAIPREQQHRLLFFGVLGALLLRGAFIAAGAALLDTFSWVLYLFGAFLVFTGIRLARGNDHQVDPQRNVLLRLLRTRLRLGAWGAALVAIETTDVVFAADSIPAVFAVTDEPFIVFTSNAFAILGLRALYFLLADAVQRFEHLDLGLAAVLVFVGAKLLLVDVVHVPIAVSLAIIVMLIGAAIVASQLSARSTRNEPVAPTSANRPESSARQ